MTLAGIKQGMGPPTRATRTQPQMPSRESLQSNSMMGAGMKHAKDKDSENKQAAYRKPIIKWLFAS